MMKNFEKIKPKFQARSTKLNSVGPLQKTLKKDLCLQQIEDSLFQLEYDLARFCFALKELKEIL